MRVADIPALAGLWVDSWGEAMPAIDFDARRPWILGFLADPAHTTIVAESDARALGFVSLEGATLHQIAVAPASKGGGVAVALLDAAKARCPAGLALDVNQTNARAVRFYEREGFRRVGAGVNLSSGLATWTMHWGDPRVSPKIVS